MASSAPPVLPVTNNKQQVTTTPPPTTLRSFKNKTTETINNSFSKSRPWGELIVCSAFSKPDSVSDAKTRIRKNYTYFRINYLTIIICVLGFSLITNPLCLLVFAFLLAAWLFLYLLRNKDDPLVICGRKFPDTEILGGLILFSIVVIFLTSLGSVLVSALMFGLAFVCAHAVFRTPQDLFLLDQRKTPATDPTLVAAAANSADVFPCRRPPL